ncbi:MAG: hypothetical protein QOG67_505, partial [Verrucomicrobiota bacterium]
KRDRDIHEAEADTTLPICSHNRIDFAAREQFAREIAAR